MAFEDCFVGSRHSYELASTGFKRRELDKEFSTREAATKFMYDLCAKNGLRITEVWDDGHCKTYRCGSVSFYVSRV